MDGTSSDKTFNKYENMLRPNIFDSTAPPGKIVKALLARERFSKAYKLYRTLLVQRRDVVTNCRHYHYVIPGHPLKTFPEKWNGDLKLDYFQKFEYKCTKPKIITRLANFNRSDPVTDHMMEKQTWDEDTINHKYVFSLMYQKRNVHYLNDEVLQCPKFLITLARMLESDPDPNFTASYNWYYAGNGNMQAVCINWVDYLLHSHFNTLYLTRLHKEDMSIEPDHEANYECESGNILETLYSSQNIVALRTMKKVIIINIIERDNRLYFEKIKQIESTLPFTSISFDTHHTNILYITTLNCELSIVNIDRITKRSVKLKRSTDSNVDNWNSVIGHERGLFMHIEKRKISFYDKRTNGVVNSWDGVRNLVDNIHCSGISAVKCCNDSPSLYLSTNHNLFLMDTRCNSSTNLKVIQRWTHGIRFVPTYMSICKCDENKDFIVISSQWCEDTCVVSNYADSVVNSCDIPGVTMPYHPPHILNTLNEARLGLLCFDMHKPIEARLVSSTTGLLVSQHRENFSILTQNSLGDMFLRTLYPSYNEPLIEDDSVKRLHEWVQPYQAEKKIFEVSHIIDISNVWKKLKRVPENYDFGPEIKNFKINEAALYKAYENQELMPELLDPWMSKRNYVSNTDDDDDSYLPFDLHHDDNDIG